MATPSIDTPKLNSAKEARHDQKEAPVAQWAIADTVSLLEASAALTQRPDYGNAVRDAYTANPHNQLLASVAIELASCNLFGNIAYQLINPDQPVDYSPNQRAVALFPEIIPSSTMDGWLVEAGMGGIHPKRYSVDELMDTDRPVVVKDPTQHRGVNKLLLRDQREKTLAVSALRKAAAKDTQSIIIEDFIENPGKYATTIRILALPDGTLLDAKVLSSNTPRTAKRKHRPDVLQGDLFTSLGKQLPAYSFMSNVARGGIAQALLVREGQEFTAPPRRSKTRDNILEGHDIDPNDRTLPDEIKLFASRIAQTLGPAHGIVTGIDIIIDASGKPHLLEINSAPLVGNIETDTLHFTTPSTGRAEVYTTRLQLLPPELPRDIQEHYLYYLAALERFIQNHEQ